MKTNPSSKTSFRCALARFGLALSEKNPHDHHHVQRCAYCQDHYRAAAGLDAALRHEARATRVAPSAGLELQIMAAVQRETRAPRRVERPAYFRFAVMGGVAAIAAVGLWRYAAEPHGSTPIAKSPTEVDPDVASLAATVRSFPATLQAKLAQPAMNFAEQNSLRSEVDNLYADTQSALRFLATNFLPADTSAHAAEPSKS